LGHGVWTRDEWRSWGISEWQTVDITLENLMTYAGRPQAIVHCAGSGSVVYSASHPHQDYLRTVATTSAVLEFARLHAPEAGVVYPSSAAVYGQARRIPIPETAELTPVSPYGVHKLMAEMQCRMYARQFGTRTAILRMFSVYGNGLRKQLLWDACSKLRRGEIRFHGTGAEQRDWLSISDAANLLVLACGFASPECPIVNGGTGVGVQIADVIGEIATAFGRGKDVEFSGKRREVDPAAYVADISAALARGWKPAVSWREGVRAYIDWFRANEN
jgi:UDP-glucose 4-epimerase